MNKTAIRNFAIWARNKLIADVSYKAGLMGIAKDGIAEALPQSTSDVEFYDIGTAEPYSIHNGEIKQRKTLVVLIRQKENDSDYITEYSSVMEEVAYTWFIRLIAVRFMEVNDYMPAHIRVLSSETGKLEPDIVTTPFDAELELTDAEKQQIIQLKNDNKLDDCFRMLFIKQCNALHEMLPRLFENTKDYSELLLNVSFVDQEGVVYHLVHDIEEDDFNIEKGGQVEIIGWLYQYYNSELKDETFALLKNNVKVTKERIPSATQLFTPDWIVRYMVENSLGHLWKEGHPNDGLRAEWKYYLNEAEQESEVNVQLDEIRNEYARLNPEDIKVIDPCMGSGHILVYAFDVLMQIYESAGYNQREAARSILENNLYGLDIDERAAQLAYFAVLMKARQYNRRIFSDYSMCNVYAIRESNGIDKSVLGCLGEASFIGEKLIDGFINAKEYGSILNLDITEKELSTIEDVIIKIKNKSSYENMHDAMNSEIVISQVTPLLLQAKVLVSKYDVVITNPPYMGAGGMGKELASYVKEHYNDEKNDMFAVFVSRCRSFTRKNGYYAMITQPSLLFLTSFENLRYKLTLEQEIHSLLHMGRGIFGIDFGSTAFVIRNRACVRYIGRYFRLHARTFQYIDPDDIKKLFLNAKADDEYEYDFSTYNGETEEVDNESSVTIKLPYYTCQEEFEKIPGVPFAYWLSKRMVDCFSKKKISDIADPKAGLQTGDNNRFIRLWEEIDYTDSSLNNPENVKWWPYNKGGDYRRWYGNCDYLINWENDGEIIKAFKGSVIRNPSYYFKPSITWSFVSSNSFGVRYSPNKTLFDVGGSSLFPREEDMYYLTALLNSKLSTEFMRAQNPTLNFQVGNVANIPVTIEKKDVVDNLSKECISISQKDWDSFETSWDFKKHPLV